MDAVRLEGGRADLVEQQVRADDAQVAAAAWPTRMSFSTTRSCERASGPAPRLAMAGTMHLGAAPKRLDPVEDGHEPGGDVGRRVAIGEVVRAEDDDDVARAQMRGVDRVEAPERVLDAVAGQAEIEHAPAGEGGVEQVLRPGGGVGIAEQDEIGGLGYDDARRGASARSPSSAARGRGRGSPRVMAVPADRGACSTRRPISGV